MTLEQENEERERLIAEAKEWLCTPYHTGGRIKGAGCDCGTFLAEVWERAGLTEHIEIPYYPEDIACHCAIPRYLMKIEEYCQLVMDGTRKKGDTLVYWFSGSKVPHHAAIVYDDRYIIHSYTSQGVILSNMRGYERNLFGVYRLKRWCS